MHGRCEWGFPVCEAKFEFRREQRVCNRCEAIQTEDKCSKHRDECSWGGWLPAPDPPPPLPPPAPPPSPAPARDPGSRLASNAGFQFLVVLMLIVGYGAVATRYKKGQRGEGGARASVKREAQGAGPEAHAALLAAGERASVWFAGAPPSKNTSLLFT